MSKTITIDDDAYKLLSSLKQGDRDSFTKVILRHVRKPADTCGELLDMFEAEPPAGIDASRIDAFVAERGRRSRRRR
ncbi:MAG: antitoxin VapB family protein [Verrucomicrobiota bacterium]|jgi:hypothetical protein